MNPPNSRRWLTPIAACFCGLLLVAQAVATATLSDVKHAIHNNRVFVTWSEAGELDSVRVKIDGNGQSQTTLIPYPHSATDYYGSYTRMWKQKDYQPAVWPLPLDVPISPGHGLFVHVPEAKGSYTYTFTPLKGGEAVGAPLSLKGVEVGVAVPFEPYQTAQTGGEGAFTKTKPLEVIFHAIGGYVDEIYMKAVSTNAGNLPMRCYVHWHNDGARLGIPNRFGLIEQENRYQLFLDDSFRPSVRRGRHPFTNTWWYGTNEFVHEPAKMAKGKVYPYTHRRLEKTIPWVIANIPADPERVFGYGGSMGGTGLLCFALTHPEMFSGIHVNVPAVDLPALVREKRHYSYKDLWGGFEDSAMLASGQPFDIGVNMTQYLNEHPSKPYPFVSMYHGRVDGWMYWHYNPPFYHAMDRAGLSRMVRWGPQGHSGRYAEPMLEVAGKPGSIEWLSSLRVEEAQIGFRQSNFSSDPGGGSVQSGSPVGYIGTGFETKVLKDSPDEFSFTFKSGGGVTQIVLVPRRLQQFKVAPKDRKTCTIFRGREKEAEQACVVDENGMFSIHLTLTEYITKPRTITVR